MPDYQLSHRRKAKVVTSDWHICTGNIFLVFDKEGLGTILPPNIACFEVRPFILNSVEFDYCGRLCFLCKVKIAGLKPLYDIKLKSSVINCF
jgi:hypothetical protein